MRGWGSGTAAIVRVLVAADEPLSGTAIAGLAGVTQPRVSQVLKRFRGRGGVDLVTGGYVGKAGVLLDLYRVRFRFPLSMDESYWFSVRSMADQIERVERVAEASGVRVAWSADFSVDLVVPWRHPTLSVLYVDDVLGLADAGFVPAEGRGDASLIVRKLVGRAFPGAVAPWARFVDGVGVADPCQQWWDLLDLGGDDRVEAAGRVRTAIIERSLPRDP